MDPVAVTLALVVTAIAALVQGTVGVGFAMVAVPILSLIDPDFAPVPQILIVLPLTLAMAWRERGSMDLAGVGWIIAGRFPGAAIGVVLLAVATEQVLDIVIGAVVLAAVAVIGTGFHISRTTSTKFFAGVAAGTTGMVASIGGPPVALIYTREEAATIRSTLAAIFSFGVALTVAVRYATGNITRTDVEVALILFPALVVGYIASLFVKDRVPQHGVRIAILTVSALAGAALIVRAVV